MPESEAICRAYNGATERDNWGRRENGRTCKGGSESNGGCDEVLDREITSLVVNTVPNTINYKLEYKCCNEAVRLLNTNLILQSTDDHVPGYKYSIRGLPGAKLLAHQVWTIWFIVGRWISESDMPGALVVDEMGLGKTFTSVAAATICKLLTENVVMGLQLSILWGNTLEELVNMAQRNFPRIISEEQEWNPLRRQNSVPHRLTEIQETTPQGHPALSSSLKPILVVPIPAVAETMKGVMDEMTYETDFKLINLLHQQYANLTHKDLNTSVDESENCLIIKLVSYDTLISSAKRSHNGQLSYCTWSFAVFDEFHRYKTKNCVGWHIAITARIGFKHQVIATRGLYSLYNWCYHTIWLCSGVHQV